MLNTKSNVKYYRSTKTNMIHMVSEFPAPRTPGHVQCGNNLIVGLKPLTKAEVRRAHDYEFCKKCSQLLGLT